MATSTAVVNYDGPADDDAFEKVISASPQPMQDLARAVRALVYDVLPETVEVVWPTQGSTGWGTGPKKYSEQFAYFKAFQRHVTLGFYYGGELPDPDGLLPDQGGRQASGSMAMRSLRLTTMEDVGRPALRALIDAATRHRVPPRRS